MLEENELEDEVEKEFPPLGISMRPWLTMPKFGMSNSHYYSVFRLTALQPIISRLVFICYN